MSILKSVYFQPKFIKSKLYNINFNELEEQQQPLYIQRQPSYNCTCSQRNFELSFKNIFDGYGMYDNSYSCNPDLQFVNQIQ
ncbi:unnamed protein product [Paramecium sonneborni]|uniref:Uncharacterized protein n=1 Tax=Paramecium sonneborni TaxID=65129 RepID=A0A8S1PIB6_9CILI|nr:unnamed protein product [Paramecium sonneborni]